jgi:hypothetical protein
MVGHKIERHISLLHSTPDVLGAKQVPSGMLGCYMLQTRLAKSQHEYVFQMQISSS